MKFYALKKVHSWFDDLLWLVYPILCSACERPLNKGERCLCTRCRFFLPKTNFHFQPDNPVAKHFWGKIKIEAAAAYYHFTKGEKVQHLVHQLKYRNRKDIGVFIGELYGYDLLRSKSFSSVDLIIPVPLHEKKLRKRGYNQSDCFAEGLSKSMNIPYDPKTVRRNSATETQTRKHRFERFENVNRVFSVDDPESLRNKHVLLVDDVVTTGSTLVACAEALLEIPGTRVSIATIAYA